MSALFVEDVFFFLLYNMSFLFKNQVFIGEWINIWVLNSMALVHLSVFMLISGCFHSCSSIMELDIRDGGASGISFIV